MDVKAIITKLPKVSLKQGLVAGAGLIFGVVLFFAITTLQGQKEAPVEETPLVQDESKSALAFPPSQPTRLLIPNLKLNTTFVEPLGLLPNGEAAVPDSYGEVGWYKYSPTPGSLGPSVIFGHVDSYTGPAVFFSLGQLKVGDDIYIEREDRTTVHFKVESMERPAQSEFPTARVYGDIDYAGLRLITCTGIYVRGTQRYTHNLIVYARLVE